MALLVEHQTRAPEIVCWIPSFFLGWWFLLFQAGLPVTFDMQVIANKPLLQYLAVEHKSKSRSRYAIPVIRILNSIAHNNTSPQQRHGHQHVLWRARRYAENRMPMNPVRWSGCGGRRAGLVQEFSAGAEQIAAKRLVNRQMLSQHGALLDLLEVPQLIDTCVRNGNYDEALDLEAFMGKLCVLHQGVPAVHDLQAEVRAPARPLSAERAREETTRNAGPRPAQRIEPALADRRRPRWLIDVNPSASPKPAKPGVPSAGAYPLEQDTSTLPIE